MSTHKSGLSTGAKAGIGVGIAILIIALALLCGLYVTIKRRQNPTKPRKPEKRLPPSPKELKGARSFATELDASQPGQHPGLESGDAAELDGSSTHRKSWFSQPRRTHVVELHSMFSIQASVKRLPSREGGGGSDERGRS